MKKEKTPTLHERWESDGDDFGLSGADASPPDFEEAAAWIKSRQTERKKKRKV